VIELSSPPRSEGVAINFGAIGWATVVAILLWRRGISRLWAGPLVSLALAFGLAGNFMPILLGMGDRGLNDYTYDTSWYLALPLVIVAVCGFGATVGLLGATASLAITGWPWGPPGRRVRWRRRRSAG